MTKTPAVLSHATFAISTGLFFFSNNLIFLVPASLFCILLVFLSLYQLLFNREKLANSYSQILSTYTIVNGKSEHPSVLVDSALYSVYAYFAMVPFLSAAVELTPWIFLIVPIFVCFLADVCLHVFNKTTTPPQTINAK